MVTEATAKVDIEARVRGLSPEKRALLRQRLLEKEASASFERAIRRRTPADPPVLTFAQQGLWFLDQLKPGTSTYNVPFYCRLHGPLKVNALVKAIETVIERHEALRTAFLSRDGLPIPAVLNNWAAELRQVDLRELPDATREAEAERLFRSEAERPFDLSRDLLLRTMLIRLRDDEHIFLHVTHHIAWDLRSREILYQELAICYGAFSAGRSPVLPELSIQYGDYALWERTWLQGEVLANLVSYWKQQLASAPPKLELPADRPRPPVQSLRGAKIAAVLPKALLDRTKAISRQTGVTTFMTLLAAFDTLLYCYTGQRDICVGSPIASRPRPETEPIIGFFINTVVLRTKLDSKDTFRALMDTARDVTLSAIAHQALPFDKLVEAVKPPRDLSRMPLFQVNLRVQNAPPAPLELAGLSVSPPVFIDSGTSKFDLGLELPSTEDTRGFWEYSADLFEEKTIIRMAADFEKLLEALFSQPDTSLDAIAFVKELRSRFKPTRPTLKPRRPPELDKISAAEKSTMSNPSTGPLVVKQAASEASCGSSNGGLALKSAPGLRGPVPKPGAYAIPRRRGSGPAPLSFAQQQLWFLDQLEPGTPTYNIAFYCRISGPLDVQVLHEAVHAIVGRQEVLRTVFAAVGGKPFPVVLKQWRAPQKQIDLRAVPQAERERKAQRLLQEEAARPFNLGRDVMLRTLLLRLGDEDHYFLQVSHHIAWEYWSTLIWYQELGSFYEAFRAGRPPLLPDLPIQYADYAVWQREGLQGEVLDKLVSYWKQQLGDAPSKLGLPTDRPRPRIRTLRGSRLPVDLPPALLDSAKALSRDSGVTLFMTLLAAFKTFLYCYTGQEDVCVGSPIASRRREETKSLIGFFANTVVLRTKLSNDPTFRELSSRVRNVTLGAIANQGLPFDKIVEAVRPPRDLSRMPLFQVNFRVLKVPPDPLKIPGLVISRPEFIDNRTSKFDLSLELVANPAPSGYGSRGFWEYSTDLFDELTIARMSVDFEKLLNGLISQPDTPLNSVAVVRELFSRRIGIQRS